MWTCFGILVGLLPAADVWSWSSGVRKLDVAGMAAHLMSLRDGRWPPGKARIVLAGARPLALHNARMRALDNVLSARGMSDAQRGRLCGVPFTLSERRASRGQLKARALRTLAVAGVGIRKPRRLGSKSRKGRAFTLMLNP